MPHPRNWNYLESLPNKESKAAYMAGGKVTTDIIWQIEDRGTKKLKRYFVAKIRGITVSDGEKYRFETREEARAFGREMLESWKRGD